MMKREFCYLLIVCALVACILPAVQAADNQSIDEAIQLYNRADQYINVGDYESALVLLDQALAMNTTQFVSSGARTYALLDKSKVQIELGDLDGAIVTIDKALALEETDKLWNNRGYVLFRLGKYDEAVNAYNIALKITPDYTVALINKGDALMKLGKYQDAIDSYTAAFVSDAEANDLSLNQKAVTWKDMGDAYSALGKYREAITAYKSSLVNDPENTETAAALARAQQQAGTTVMIIGGVAVIVLIAALAYFLLRKRAVEPAPEKGKKKKW